MNKTRTVDRMPLPVYTYKYQDGSTMIDEEKKEKQFIMRLSALLHEELKAFAAIECRSMNNQAIIYIKRGIAADKAKGRKSIAKV